MGDGTCPVPPVHKKSETRGIAWLVGGFVFCPCHLPLTLGAIASLLSGTAVGALVSGHPWIAGILVTLVWIVMWVIGFRRLLEKQ